MSTEKNFNPTNNPLVKEMATSVEIARTYGIVVTDASNPFRDNPNRVKYGVKITKKGDPLFGRTLYCNHILITKAGKDQGLLEKGTEVGISVHKCFDAEDKICLRRKTDRDGNTVYINKTNADGVTVKEEVLEPLYVQNILLNSRAEANDIADAYDTMENNAKAVAQKPTASFIPGE